MALRQRQKTNARLSFANETTFDSDTGITTAYILNLAGEVGFDTSQGRTQVPVFKGNANPHLTVLSRILAGGRVPMQLEFLTSGRLWKCLVGSGGYARPGGGTTTLHDFQTPTVAGSVPGSCQLQVDSLETTAIAYRNRGVMVNEIAMQYQTDGGAGMDVDFQGVGDEVQSQIVANPTNEGFTPVNYFNGYFNLNTIALQGLNSFNFKVNQGITRTEAAFTGGLAGSMVGNNFDLSGTIGLLLATSGASPEADFNFYNYAVNDTPIPIDVAWANAANASADQYCRLRVPAAKFTRNNWKPGGPGGLMISQDFRAEAPGNLAAEVFGTVRAATFNVTGTNNIFTIKLDGGANVAVTLTTGAARTPAQIAADLNTNGSFSAGMVADVFFGRLRVTSKGLANPGSGGSLQFVTGQVNGCETLLGFDNVVRSGYTVPWLFQIYNTLSSNY